MTETYFQQTCNLSLKPQTFLHLCLELVLEGILPSHWSVPRPSQTLLLHVGSIAAHLILPSQIKPITGHQIKIFSMNQGPHSLHPEVVFVLQGSARQIHIGKGAPHFFVLFSSIRTQAEASRSSSSSILNFFLMASGDKSTLQTSFPLSSTSHRNAVHPCKWTQNESTLIKQNFEISWNAALSKSWTVKSPHMLNLHMPTRVCME